MEENPPYRRIPNNLCRHYSRRWSTACPISLVILSDLLPGQKGRGKGGNLDDITVARWAKVHIIKKSL